MSLPRIAATTCGALALIGVVGCNDTRIDPSSCYERSCGVGYFCNPDRHRCMPADGGGLDVARADVRPSPDAPPMPVVDAGVPDAPSVDVSNEGVAPTSLDSAADRSIDTPEPVAIDAQIDVAVDAAPDYARDTRAPDVAGTCAGDGDCGAATPYCVDGRCVACRTSAQCQGGAPICSPSHACISCGSIDAGCAGATPACEADSGRCVECVSNDGCSLATKPICDRATNTCVPCTRDEQCTGIGPGICMGHLDGHCAADVETVYVGSTGAVVCSDTLPSAGSAAVPYCSAKKAVVTAKAKNKDLILLSGALTGGLTDVALTAPLTVVGRDLVLVPAQGSDGVAITAGEIYLRDLTIVGGVAGDTGAGINAQAAASATLTVHVDGCTIQGNPGGGILLAGAAFDIRNTVVSGNGPGQTAGGTTFGGIRIDKLPPSGTTHLDRVTIRDNLGPGLSCAGAIDATTSVLASGNATPNVTTSCALTPCAPASTTCGAP